MTREDAEIIHGLLNAVELAIKFPGGEMNYEIRHLLESGLLHVYYADKQDKDKWKPSARAMGEKRIPVLYA